MLKFPGNDANNHDIQIKMNQKNENISPFRIEPYKLQRKKTIMIVYEV